MITAVDLFAGCGGLSKGFEKAGFNVLAAFENWPQAIACYRENFTHEVYDTDLSDTSLAVKQIEALAPDIIIGGPPCQDFSHAGKRIEAKRASLTESYARIISSVKPKYFLMENVDRAQKSRAYSDARQVFKEAGYGLTERVLLASYCGVPQRRKRFFCIGVLGEEDGTLDEYLTKNLSEKEMTVRDYFGDTLDIEYYYRHPRNYSRRGVFSIDEPAPTMRGVNRPVPKGYPGHPNDACKINPSIRCLTTLERSLIQTFPADFKWIGSKTDCEQMVGNAVPVNLAFYVASSILEFVKAKPIAAVQEDGFKEWLCNSKGLSDRSACDVISRIKRADKLCPYYDESIDAYLQRLDVDREFIALSMSIKSQLKRSWHLFAEYSVA